MSTELPGRGGVGGSSSHSDHGSQASCFLAFKSVADPGLSPACSKKSGRLPSMSFHRPDVCPLAVNSCMENRWVVIILAGAERDWKLRRQFYQAVMNKNRVLFLSLFLQRE